MRKTRIMLLAVAMALVIALPAAAKKPVDDPKLRYLATIEHVSTDGIATACVYGDGEPVVLELVRTNTRGGAVGHFESKGAMLYVTADGLAWNGTAITDDCFGANVWPEYFRITLDNITIGDDGTVVGGSVAILWIFDVDQHEVTIPRKGGNKTDTIRTDVRLGGPYDDDGDFVQPSTYQETDGTISFTVEGQFNFVQYTSNRDPLFIRLDNGAQTFMLDVTLTEDP